MPALGDEFRRAREARGLTLSDVADRIHIRSVYLNAIENEEWASIGAPVYVRGFIRTYARFLGLDSEALVAHFGQTLPPERPAHAVAGTQISERDSGPAPSPWAVLGVLVALILVGFVGYEYWAFSQGGGNRAAVADPAASQAGASASPQAGVAAAAAPPAHALAAPTPVPQHRLAMRLTQRSWVRVAVDGKTQIEGIFPAGTMRTFSGDVADVRVGNAGGVMIATGKRPAAPLGKSGDVVEQHFPL